MTAAHDSDDAWLEVGHGRIISEKEQAHADAINRLRRASAKGAKFVLYVAGVPDEDARLYVVADGTREELDEFMREAMATITFGLRPPD